MTKQSRRELERGWEARPGLSAGLSVCMLGGKRIKRLVQHDTAV
jgi:hypothetical protein